MIIPILSIILCINFLVLGLIHMNWARGGEWGFAQSLPKNEKGERILNPKKSHSAIVGMGLFLFGFFYLLRTNMLDIEISPVIFTFGGWLIPTIFLLRALGDFKYMGFFKKITGTQFGRLDTLFYSPLCLTVALFGFAIQLL